MKPSIPQQNAHVLVQQIRKQREARASILRKDAERVKVNREIEEQAFVEKVRLSKFLLQRSGSPTVSSITFSEVTSPRFNSPCSPVEVGFRTGKGSPLRNTIGKDAEGREGGPAGDTMLDLLDPEEGKDAKIDDIEIYKLKRLVEENKDLQRKLSETTQELDRVKNAETAAGEKDLHTYIQEIAQDFKTIADGYIEKFTNDQILEYRRLFSPPCSSDRLIGSLLSESTHSVPVLLSNVRIQTIRP